MIVDLVEFATVAPDGAFFPLFLEEGSLSVNRHEDSLVWKT